VADQHSKQLEERCSKGDKRVCAKTGHALSPLALSPDGGPEHEGDPRASGEIKQLADRNSDHKAIHGLADRWIGIDDAMRLVFRSPLCAIIAPPPPRS
jgi:hypothetical protein